jgi:hypothetical protein|tara:strand:- start:402 stop:740 length:339 start_codon:yes stop_codon:yes gene_type:complete
MESLTRLALAGAVGFGVLTGMNADAHAFEKEDVLTISFRDYAESKKKKLSDYKTKGVSYKGSIATSHSYCTEELAREINKNFSKTTEVVVDFNFRVEDGWMVCYGTSLIPKE